MKKLTSIAIIFSLVFSVAVPPKAAYAQASLPITASSAVLLDLYSSDVIYAKRQHEKRAPASTTKILTAMVVLDSLPLDTVVTIPKFAESIEPSKAYLKEGERYYVKDLVKAILVNSANDAAEVLAHVSGGSREAFSDKMNQKARSIGCKNSNFIRASGLPAGGQYSTAYDLALIMQNAQKYPFIVQTMKLKTGVIYSLDGRKIYLKNHNKMLWRDHREVIGKTGWTRKAKHCFVGSIRAASKTVGVSMLGSQNLWRDLKVLVDYQFGKSYKKVKQNRKLWGREETEEIQTALKRAGHNPGKIDGKFGPATLKAVVEFQKAQGLKPDGIVGPVTRKALQKFLA